MPRQISAGLLMFSETINGLKVFLVHPGGPFFSNKDDGYWGIPKGLIEENEELLTAAKREFEEETGIKQVGELIHLDTVIQSNNKEVHAWAFKTENDKPIEITCNTFEMEWPPHAGKRQKFPEVDKGEFFTIEEAKMKMYSAQHPFLERLQEHLKNNKG
jgi:predicted NUDIX family NTP pyrophosphohydrolase